MVWRSARTLPAALVLSLLSSSSALSTGTFELELFSPAKISVFTRILRRYDDGCHEVASLSQTVDFGDQLRLARIPADRFAAAGVVRPSRVTEPIKQHVELSVSPANPGIPLDESNLVVRAIALFRTKLAQRDGGSLTIPRFRAHLVKSIPPDSGLGGASSNAATALWGVRSKRRDAPRGPPPSLTPATYSPLSQANELCGRPASAAELEEWSRELGGDVACFLTRGSAFCHGRAVFHRPQNVDAIEPLTAADASASLYVVLPANAGQLSTPRLFRTLADGGYTSLSASDPHDLLASHQAQSGAQHVNDLEPPALQCSSELAAVKQALLAHGFHAVVLSGAGPALFAFGESGSDPQALAQRATAAIAESTGAALDIRAAEFLSRESGGWYHAQGAVK